MTVLEHALAAARAGMQIIPLHGTSGSACTCGDPKCKSPGKHPRVGAWQQEATSDEAKVRAWFGFWPNSSYGIATGEGSGVWVLDVDPRHGGQDALTQLRAERGELPDTLTIRTGSGGLHVYFRHVHGLRNSGGKIGGGIDVRGEGGYVVGPGCPHASGSIYEALRGGPIADAPEWLVEAAKARAPRQNAQAAIEWAPLDHGVELDAVRAAAAMMVERLPPGVEGRGGGVALLHVTRDLFRGWGLDEDDHTFAIILRYCARCEPPWEDARQIKHKIEQGKRGDQDPEGRPVGYLYRKWREGKTKLPPVRLDVDEHRCITEVVERMSKVSDLYVSAGALADVIRQDGDDPEEGGEDGVRRYAGSPRVRRLPPARVRTVITMATDLEKWDGRARDWNPSHPTDWLVSGVHAEGTWRGVSGLRGIGDAPVILADGRVLAEQGYDRESGILISHHLNVSVPERPTANDARAAGMHLFDLVSQFDFATAASASAWLCALLTVVGRFAFRGSTPLMLLDASTPGSGKTMLVDLISAIAFGRQASRCAWSSQDEEIRKTITATAMAGDRMLLFDNVPNGGVLQSSALDAALTSDGRWSSRILGTMDKYDGPLLTVFFATGNNLGVGGDLARRVLQVRLEPRVDRPEMRSGFKYPALVEHVRRNRALALGAALTILRAHIIAGRKAEMNAWGSFEGWSATVRGAVVAAGFSDPGETRENVHATADRSRGGAATLIEELSRLVARKCQPGEGLSAKEILQGSMELDQHLLRDALDELCNARPGQRPSPYQVGRALSAMRGRRYDGRCVTIAKKRKKDGVDWTIE